MLGQDIEFPTHMLGILHSGLPLGGINTPRIDFIQVSLSLAFALRRLSLFIGFDLIQVGFDGAVFLSQLNEKIREIAMLFTVHGRDIRDNYTFRCPFKHIGVLIKENHGRPLPTRTKAYIPYIISDIFLGVGRYKSTLLQCHINTHD